MPSLKKLHLDFLNENFVLLTINVQEKPDIVGRFAKDNGMSFPILLDTDGLVSYAYQIRSHPSAYLIDAKGNISGVAIGYRKWDRKEMKALVFSLLSTSGLPG